MKSNGSMTVSKRGNTGRRKKAQAAAAQPAPVKQNNRQPRGIFRATGSPFFAPGERSRLLTEKTGHPPRRQAGRSYHDTEERADHCCGVVFQSQRHRNIPRQAAQNDTCRQSRVYLRLTVKSRKKQKSCDNSRPDDTFPVRAVFIVKNAVFPKSRAERKHPKNAPIA